MLFCFTASDTADVPGALEDSHSRYGCEGAWLYVSRDADELLESALLDYSPRIRPPRFRVLKIRRTSSPANDHSEPSGRELGMKIACLTCRCRGMQTLTRWLSGGNRQDIPNHRNTTND